MAIHATAGIVPAPPTAAARANGPARPLVFLDFEACGLAPASWPIEIGLAWIEGGRVRVEAHLIAPRRDWDLGLWCPTAARVHGIGLGALLAAPPADAIAPLTDRLAGCDVVSDNPRWDQRWLDRLRRDRAPRVHVTGLREAVRRRLSDHAAGTLSLALLRSPSPHRAGADAARLARAWAEAEADAEAPVGHRLRGPRLNCVDMR